MKKVLISILSAFLLAAPAAISASEPAASYSLDKKKTNAVTVTYNVNMHCENCAKRVENALKSNEAKLRG